MTRAKVLQLGFLVLLFGGLGYLSLIRLGIDSITSGIAVEAVLIFGIFLWTSTYVYRVVTGNMTFNEQRRRYLQSYENLKDSEIQDRFNSLPEAEQIRLLREIQEGDKSL